MKYNYSAIALIAIISTTIISCINPKGVYLYNESERDIFLKYHLKGTIPNNDYCAKGKSVSIHLSYGGSYAHLCPITIYIYCPREQENYLYGNTIDGSAFLDDIENNYTQKYVLTYEDIEYMRKSKALTFPPTAMMQNVEMDPPFDSIIP